MKKVTVLLVLVFAAFFVTSAHAIGSIGIQGGMASSSFEDQGSAASTFALGANFVFDMVPIVDVGAEFNTLLSPFEFEQEAFGQKITAKISQTYFGAFARFYPLPLPAIKPYVRAGVGYYSGKAELEGGGQSGSVDYKGTLGFNVGAGVKAIMGLYGEFVYHIVSRELDVDSAESAGSNNWMIMVGYSFEF